MNMMANAKQVLWSVLAPYRKSKGGLAVSFHLCLPQQLHCGISPASGKTTPTRTIVNMFHVVGEHWRDRPEIRPVKLNPTNRKLSAYKYSLCFSTWKEIPLSAQSQLKTTMDTVGWVKGPRWEEWVACPGNWIHGFTALWGTSLPIFCKIHCQKELLKGKVEHGNSTWLFCSA